MGSISLLLGTMKQIKKWWMDGKWPKEELVFETTLEEMSPKDVEDLNSLLTIYKGKDIILKIKREE